MSIENNLKRIADSLEIIAGVADDKAVNSFAATVSLKEAAEELNTVGIKLTAESVPAPIPVADKIVPAPTCTSIEAPAPEITTQMTLDDLNTALVAEYNRLGKDRTLIDTTVKGFGVNTATDLAPADYQAVLDKVRVLR